MLQLQNTVYKLTPVLDGWQVLITWDNPETIPNKYIVYITEPTGSRFTIIDGNTTSFSEVVRKTGIYKYRVKAVYDDKEIYSVMMTIEIGCSARCAQGGYSTGETPLPGDYIWFTMTPNRA